MATITNFPDSLPNPTKESCTSKLGASKSAAVLKGQALFDPLKVDPTSTLFKEVAEIVRALPGGEKLAQNPSQLELKEAIKAYQASTKEQLGKALVAAKAEKKDHLEILAKLRIASNPDGIIGWKTAINIREDYKPTACVVQPEVKKAPASVLVSSKNIDLSSGVAYVGDSLSVGAFGSQKNNLAHGGDTIAKIRIQALTALQSGNVRELYIGGGTNDLNHGFSPEVVAKRLVDLVAEVKKVSPTTKIFVGEIPPANRFPEKVQLANSLLHETVKGAQIVGYHSALSDGNGRMNPAYSAGDGIHFNSAGYRKMKEVALKS